MTQTSTKPLRTRGGLWGQRRVELGISMRDLERRSGIHRSHLSMAEAGRYNPTADEFAKVMAVLREQEDTATRGDRPSVTALAADRPATI